MDCKHINIVINKISTEKILVRKILCEIIKYKLNEKNKKINTSIENNDISQKIQTIFIFLMLQLYTFKTLCDVPHNKFNNVLYKKLNKISSNLNFFKKLFHFAINNVSLNNSEKKMTYLMYTWLKKIIININNFNLKINSYKNESCKTKKTYDCNNDIDSPCSKKTSETSTESDKTYENLNPVENIKKYSLDKISDKIYSNKFIKSIHTIQVFINKLTGILSILNKNIENKIEELQSDNKSTILSNYDYELINKMIFVTFIHLQHISKNINILIKKFSVDTKNYYHIIDKINIQGIYNINTKCKYNSCHLNNEKISIFSSVNSCENDGKNKSHNDTEKCCNNLDKFKAGNHFITITIGNVISKIEFISHGFENDKILETLIENKINIENIIKLLDMNNQIAKYFISIISNYETCE